MAETTLNAVFNPGHLAGILPVEVAGRLLHLDGLVFFDTSSQGPNSVGGLLSIIAASPSKIIRGNLQNLAHQELLREALRDHSAPPNDQGFPVGGLCGWISYEGDFTFGAYDEMLIYSHADQRWWEIGSLSQQLSVIENPAWVGTFEACKDREHFVKMVLSAKARIASGDIYQINLSQMFTAVATGNLFGLYEILREASPAPMAAYLHLDGHEILSSSPESFLHISGRGITTRPIKGTRPRFPDPDEDRRSAYELQTSAKEISELVMITDLLRNDLGRVCEFGSVEVTEMLRLETLAQVHHMVSTIRGTLRPEMDAISTLAACFPGGSITGAPKKRAMEIIRELEGAPRGVYCGAIGFLGYNGESSFNIAIRTMVREGDRVIYQVGAGIVADSDPEKEFEETLHKAAGIRLAIERWQASKS